MKQAFPAVSIVLPVYNGEKYLVSAIESVLAQSFEDWELLIIDDGSSDRSPSICDKYAEKDPRIKVFHQPNGGVNTARAKGVDNSAGEYLLFLDADDTFSPDAVDYLLAHYTEEDDLLVCGKETKSLSKEEYIAHLWTGSIAPALWGKMFKASVYKQMDYAIDRRLVMGEDLLLNSMYALECRIVKVVPREVYLVNHDNETSVTRTFKHNCEYEKFYFRKVQELFLGKCNALDSYEQIKLLVNKSWLNAMKYTMLDGGSIDYKDSEFKEINLFFTAHKKELGRSERLLFLVKNPVLYRLIIKTYLNHRITDK